MDMQNTMGQNIPTPGQITEQLKQVAYDIREQRHDYFTADRLETQLVRNLHAAGIVNLQPTSMPTAGLFVVLEGGEGAGKSEQALRLATALSHMGVRNILTREPGDTVLGANLREILLDEKKAPLSRKAEALLFAADRAEHVETVIMPALNAGKVVICDRFIASTMAYQVHAGGLDEKFVRSLCKWSAGGLRPDVTYFLDVDPIIGLQRAKKNGAPDRYESEKMEFHHKVRRGFVKERQMAQNWVTIHAQMDVDTVHQNILGHLTTYQAEKLQPKEQMRFVSCPRCGANMDADPVLEKLYICPDGCGKMRFYDTKNP